MFRFLPLLALGFSAIYCGQVDSIAARIDSAFRFLNSEKFDSARVVALTLEPGRISPSLQSHASRLALAGLHAQPGSPAWIEWTAKFDMRVWTPREKLWILAAALNTGHAQSLPAIFGNSDGVNADLRHEWEILQARLQASKGQWKEAESRLENWKNNSDRREGSGEILFWQGWANLHQGRRLQADTLFLLASAYAGEDASQRALEYRFALQLDSGKALEGYIRGLPESPLPASKRLTSLEAVPVSSSLHPSALWAKAQLEAQAGNKDLELAALEELKNDLSTLPGRRASARLTHLRFEPAYPDSAMAAYERLLLKYQQGVPSEFAKSRVKALRSAETGVP